MDEFSVTPVQAVCFGSSLAISCLCYYLFRKTQKIVDDLDNAQHLTINGQLKDILAASPGKSLQYVVIEGTVHPEGSPLRSWYQRETFGVLQKIRMVEYRQIWDRLTHTWIDHTKVLREEVDMVPFVLVGSDEATVRVRRPLEASGVHMATTYENFYQTDSGIFELLGQHLRGDKVKGQLHTEEILKVGTLLQGVGKLVLDGDGSMSLCPPDGPRYFLSIGDFDTLRGEQENQAYMWKMLTIVFALSAAAVVIWVGSHYYRKLKARWKEKQLMNDLTSVNAQTPCTEAESNACVICLSEPRDCVLLNCGHLCCCISCFQAFPQPRCPICRQTISRAVPVFYS
ncbi:mitochondrial ubiquitin ligase activator of nfkb 1-A [Thalassophryne amazonica]|uniref:mitochondrial ubiquitin ligase activator of nfkb 1-A n=1 Tax=Thalassophryne amazonica TaxID=390379 RepID=UPI001470FE21|nr:mitochondrial ubiquitin ligase activator of nfkb 1-A [Thalassophryne amazonica]XP_034038653.1 mitochondrial ubiquitin ligase activator of nfkb 1-A [Thalassophryne amazonica]